MLERHPSDDEVIAEAREALKRTELPAGEHWQRLIDIGLIDEHGRVRLTSKESMKDHQ